MLKNFKTNKILWNITAGLALIAAGAGIFNTHIYDGVFAPEFITGALPQDILTVLVCIALFVLIAKAKENDAKKQVVIIGILGSFFYLYGIFTIERVYNVLYILYAAVFAISFWSLLYSLMNLEEEFLKKVKLPLGMARTSSIIGLIISVLFSFLWISALLPLMKTGNRIEYLYSIYILDLCFIMPAFFVTGIMSLQRKALGLMLMPAVFVCGFFVIFPLGLNEIAKPFFGGIINVGSMMMSFIFAALMLAVGFVQLKKIRY